MLDNCCRPMRLTLGAMSTSRQFFISDAVVELEAVAPEVVASMLEQSSSMYTVSEDGTQGLSVGSGIVRQWTGTTGLTRAYGDLDLCVHSATAWAIKNADIFTFLTQPCKSHACANDTVGAVPTQLCTLASPCVFCCIYANLQVARELPDAIVNYIEANPASKLAARFRLYARRSIVLAMQRVSELLHAHVAVMELPPTEWLVSKFPQERWSMKTAEIFQFYWVGRTEAWGALVEEWDTGELGHALPRGVDSFPLTGLREIVLWSIARGSERQRALIGCVSRMHVVVMSAHTLVPPSRNSSAIHDCALSMTAQVELPAQAYGDRWKQAPTTDADVR
eukprot:SAG31_NODE_8298_length_1478_cov_2.292966_2_plen_336_part_00